MRIPGFASFLLLASCATTSPAVDRGVKLRPDTRPECAARCEEMGMRLGAIVLIQNSAGCVCEPAESAAPTGSRATGGAVAVAGGAMIVAQAQREAEERARRDDEERRRRDEEDRRREDDEQRARDAARRQGTP